MSSVGEDEGIGGIEEDWRRWRQKHDCCHFGPSSM